MGHVGIGIMHAYDLVHDLSKCQGIAINIYFVYNINISLKSVFEIHGANLPHYHCQLTPPEDASSWLARSITIY
ncbi:hypothetical protein OUZ56_024133 [Daphnia magna]|uniref:Uncharacterized protein n=1 Tax=Daphnia magna TaxID=35525 RepID=A0ABR0B0J6_9CRUS|nr:hypothetical protein OUZ56_024133 [Daphnia magna]